MPIPDFNSNQFSVSVFISLLEDMGKTVSITCCIVGFVIFSHSCYSQNLLPGIFYKVKAVGTGLFLSVASNGMQNKAQIVQAGMPVGTCEDGQAFRFVKVGDFYKIEVRNKNGLCVVLDSAINTKLIITEFNGQDNQLWKVEKNGTIYQILNKASDFSLDASGSNSNSGPVIVSDFKNTQEQQWQLLPAEEERPYWENLGKLVNTSRTEMMPCVSPDGKMMYFTRGHVVNGFVSNGDIFVTTLNANNQWSDAKKLEALSNERHNGVVGFLPGGNSLLLFGDYSGGNALFSITQKTTSGWSKPAPLKLRVPKLTQNIWSGTVGSDGKTILVELNTTGYLDESDLFVTFFENGKWSELRNLGEVINKQGSWDGTPYLSADMTTLYFSSSRNNTGGIETFMSKRLDDTWTNWSEPLKLEVTMKKEAVIQYYLVPGDGTYAYFVSGNKSYGEGDILRMKLKSENKPDPFLIMNGRTLDSKSGTPISASIVFEDLETGFKKGSLTSDPVTGNYQIALPRGINYGVYASANGYYSITQNAELKKLTTYSEKHQDLLLAPIEVGSSVTMNNIFFERGKDVLLASSFPELERVVKMMNENPLLQVEMNGHTDNLGGVKENLLLSENRAKRVTSYLVEHGISAERLNCKGFGSSKPIVPNTSEENRKKNRRVEFVIVKK